MGKISIVILLALFAIIGVTLLYTTDKLDECKSFSGSFAQIFSPEIQQKCAKVGLFYLALIFVWILLGFMLTVLIGFIIFQRLVIGGIIYSILMTIVILKLSGVI